MRGGIEAIKPGKRGRRHGCQRVLNASQETALQNLLVDPRLCAQWKPPVVRLPAKRSSINMISSITNHGKVRFMLYRETMTAPVLIKRPDR